MASQLGASFHKGVADQTTTPAPDSSTMPGRPFNKKICTAETDVQTKSVQHLTTQWSIDCEMLFNLTLS